MREDGGYEVPLKKGDTVAFTSVPFKQTDFAIRPISVNQEGRNLFGLSDKTVRLPGHEHYFPESPKTPSTKSRPTVAANAKRFVHEGSPTGRLFAFQYEIRLTDTTENVSKPILDRVGLRFDK